MKNMLNSLVRAVMSIEVGALIIKFREETVHWLTIVIGALFFVTGLISVVLNRQRPTPLPLPVREGSNYSQGDGLQAEKHSTPSPREGGGGWLASVVGFGSIILGVIEKKLNHTRTSLPQSDTNFKSIFLASKGAQQ